MYTVWPKQGSKQGSKQGVPEPRGQAWVHETGGEYRCWGAGLDQVTGGIDVVGFPAELLLVIMIEKLTRFDYRPLLNVRVRNGVGDHHPD